MNRHNKYCSCERCFWNRYSKPKRMRKEPIDYFEYITSKAWEQRKERYYTTHKRQCEACGSNKRLNLHHITYSSLGKEKDSDLVCFCEPCHNRYHAQYATSGTTADKTRLFIRDTQEQCRHIKELLS